jgi:hypothetical protein
VWLVPDQLAPGTYTATVVANCYWERVRHFQGTFSAIIANDFVTTPGPRFVTINASDAGFHTDQECGTWTRTPGVRDSEFDSTPGALHIERNWQLHREYRERELGPR